jgi:plasmid replication initiation protein
MVQMATKTLLPQRYPNRDFFIADILDASPRDDMASMENPVFSLSKNPDREIRKYEHNGHTLTVTPSVLGRANIWDKDLLIYCTSQLIAGINLGREPSQTVRITGYDLLTATNRHTGGKDYDRLEQAFERLSGTRLRTNIETGNAKDRQGFGLIDSWKIIEQKNDDRMSFIDVKLSDWLYRAVLSKEVLSISPDYFRLRGGIERRVYELARKHCGSQARWCIGIKLLHKKTGSQSPVKRFRYEIKRIASSEIMPDYRLHFESDKDQLTVYNRKGRKAAKAQFDDQMKKLFKPNSKDAQRNLF